MENFYKDVGKYYSDIYNIYSVDFFSLSMYNNWLFFLLGLFLLISGVILIHFEENVLDNLKNTEKVLNKDNNTFNFMNLSYFDLRKLNFNKKEYLGKNELDENYLSYLKILNFKRSKLLYHFFFPIVCVFLCMVGLFSIIYSTFVLWVYEDTQFDKEFKISYLEQLEDLNIPEINSTILKMEPINLSYEYLSDELGDDFEDKLNISNNFYTSSSDLPAYKLLVKTNGKIDTLFIYEKDISINSLKETDSSLPFITYNNFGNLNNLSKIYNIKELEELINYSYVLSGLKNINIYLPENQLNSYLNEEKIIIE